MNIKDKMDFSCGVVALFAKTPRRGAVKTRIQPLLGEDGALSLHKSLRCAPWNCGWLWVMAVLKAIHYMRKCLHLYVI